MAKTPKANGRPTVYSKELAVKICCRLAQGESLRKICADSAMPSASTVLLWVVEDREGFSEHYGKARRLQAEILADELFDISDDSTNDYMLRQSKSGDEYEVINPEAIGRSRLRVDTRKWYLSKVLPKVYGERIHTEHSGSISYSDMSEDELNRKIHELQQELTRAESL